MYKTYKHYHYGRVGLGPITRRRLEGKTTSPVTKGNIGYKPKIARDFAPRVFTAPPPKSEIKGMTVKKASKGAQVKSVKCGTILTVDERLSKIQKKRAKKQLRQREQSVVMWPESRGCDDSCQNHSLNRE